MNTSNHTTTNASDGGAKCAAADGSDILIATMSGSTIDLVWYTAEGQVDTAYGSGTGIVSLSSTGWTLLGQMLVQSDGDIDLTVHTSTGGMQVAQLNADGSIDGSFGSGGLETIGSSLRRRPTRALRATAFVATEQRASEHCCSSTSSSVSWTTPMARTSCAISSTSMVPPQTQWSWSTAATSERNGRGERADFVRRVPFRPRRRIGR